MTDHLSSAVLNALADGELAADQMASASEHLAACPACTSSALHQSLLKVATAKAGARYTPPLQLQRRLTHLASNVNAGVGAGELAAGRRIWPRRAGRSGALGWAAAAAVVIASVGMVVMQDTKRTTEIASAERSALVTEVFDQHVAAMAASAAPQVISSDRHTVKPWFQGKLPFSFSLPEKLPDGAVLDGANLTYLDNQPVAQLLFSIGRHRASVFVRAASGGIGKSESRAEHSGFHVIGVGADRLDLVAVSDADPARLGELLKALRQAQTPDEVLTQ